MGRYRQLNIVVAGVGFTLLVAGGLAAQGLPQPGGPGGNPGAVPARSERPIRQRPERWRNMSPEDRQRFQSNIERWRQLPPEERRELRDREGWRQQRLKSEAEAAIRASGLQLEAEKREQFELRYLQERKRIEQELRRDLREKRERELAPVVERLKREFTQPQQQGSATSGSASPSPAK